MIRGDRDEKNIFDGVTHATQGKEIFFTISHNEKGMVVSLKGDVENKQYYVRIDEIIPDHPPIHDLTQHFLPPDISLENWNCLDNRSRFIIALLQLALWPSESENHTAWEIKKTNLREEVSNDF